MLLDFFVKPWLLKSLNPDGGVFSLETFSLCIHFEWMKLWVTVYYYDKIPKSESGKNELKYVNISIDNFKSFYWLKIPQL